MFNNSRSINNLNFHKIKINEFKNQINFFKKNYNILGYEDFVEILKTKKIPKKASILLTFDDGYKDHIENVFSILKKNNLKGFFYPPTDIFKEKLLDVSKIQLILSKKPDVKKLIKFTKDYFGINFEKKILKDQLIEKSKYDNGDITLFKRLYQYAIPNKDKKIPLNILFNKIVNDSEKSLAKKLYLNKKDLLTLSKNNMHIGIHGNSHYWWSKISNKEQMKEILGAKKYFKKLGIDASSVCYPFGGYNKDTIKILKKYNFSFSLTTKKGITK